MEAQGALQSSVNQKTESEAESELEAQGALQSSVNQKTESEAELEAESEAQRNQSQKDQKSFFFI